MRSVVEAAADFRLSEVLEAAADVGLSEAGGGRRGT